MRAIGLMSGTSLDGVDAAWIETDGERILGHGPAATLRYDAVLRADLRRLLDLAPTIDAADPFLRDVERRLTDYHAEATVMIGKSADIVGFHGQTILHAPERGVTWQIGDAAQLARKTRLRVAHDFRSADVAAGGQGAPLAPLYHEALARDLPKPLMVVNIGGVANITWLGAEGEILACDTGPGNGPLDDWVFRHTGKAFDEDGALAASGQVDEARLATLMTHPYFAKPAPKSLDRLAFTALVAQAAEGLSVADGAATLAAFTVAAIAGAPIPDKPARVLVTGGGRHNAMLMKGLRTAFACEVQPVEAVGWNGDMLEAECFGFLAVRVVRGLPLSLPETTGVSVAMRGGSCCP